MFDKTQYVVEKTLESTFLEAARDTYNVKDADGNLLGYVKKQRLRLNFWFEGADGTRMGEIRSSKRGDEVYDAHNQLRATIKRRPVSLRKKQLFLLGLSLFLAGLLVAMFGFIMYSTTPTTDSLAMGSIGITLTIFGITCLFPSRVNPEWRIVDSEGQHVAEVKQVGKFFREYRILAPDGDAMAEIQQTRGRAALRYSYSIHIISQVLDPLIVLSFTFCS